jgi:hypothetical protein
VMHGAHPVYVNADGQYLYYWQEYLDWIVGSDYTSGAAGVRSVNTKAGCPQTFNSWVYWGNSQWNSHAISVTCEACQDSLPSNYGGANRCTWSCAQWATQGRGYCSDTWSQHPHCITGTPTGYIRDSCCASCQ